LRLFRRWACDEGHPDLVLSEPLLFEYFRFLESTKAPPSRPQGLREALWFAHGAFEVDIAGFDSSRVRGLATRSLDRRGALRQRAPLSVDMVAYLESIAANEEHVDGLLAGSLLFCLMGRARVGDLRRGAVEPFRDVSAGSPVGFLQTELLAYKTARPGTKKGMPVVAPTPGVTGTDWGQIWLASRVSNGLDASVGFGLFAAPVATGGFSTLPLKTSEVGK